MNKKRTFDYDLLYDLYIAQDMSSSDMRKFLNCGNRTVLRELHKFGLVDFKNERNRDLRNSRLYSIWQGMKKRCYYTKAINYKYYGGEGIIVCDEWMNDFIIFHNWAMENGYEEDLTIDRIDNDGDYEPSNCRWVSMEIQNTNKSNSFRVKQLSMEGVLIKIHPSMIHASEVLNINYNGITQCVAGRSESSGGYIWERE